MTHDHDDLARSLADHLRGDRRMVWCDVQLGPSGSVRPDVYAIYKSFAHPAPMAYEVKVSTSDFRADVTTGKWQNYLRYACGVYFAVPAGLVTKNDVPTHCGLVVLTDGRWRAAKKATLSPVTVPQDALLKLLIDGVEREGPVYRRKHWSEYDAQATARKQFGDLVGATIRDRLKVETETDYRRRTAEGVEQDARDRAARIRKEAEEHLDPLRVELCGVLGLPATANRWDISNAIGRLRAALAEHPARIQLRAVATQLRRTLEHVDATLETAKPEPMQTDMLEAS